MASVPFVCLHNAGRSQMSQALFERAAAGRHTALSAGTTPAEHVHPEVVEVMQRARHRPICLPASAPYQRARQAGRCGRDDGLR